MREKNEGEENKKEGEATGKKNYNDTLVKAFNLFFIF
jgi:hypothetical protein